MNHEIFHSAGALALLNAASAMPAVHRLDDADADMVANTGSAFAMQDISLRAGASVQAWVETMADELGEGEGAADRLLALLVGIADENADGELGEDEQGLAEIAMNEAWAYMAASGVADSDLEALFNSEDAAEANSAAERIKEFMADALPDGDEASGAELDDFAFGTDQSSVFDAVYKKKMVVRDGKKVRVNKRVAGVVRLSSAQKVGLRKARAKSHSAKAMMRRAKSNRVRESAGL